ncbi:MAG: hypothetical protein R3Y46_06300 [Opitutales bacterium]
MQHSFNNQNLLEMLQEEKFLAFFDFCQDSDSAKSQLDGICKVAKPTNTTLAYISLTFIFDTEDDEQRILAKKAIAKLTTEAFKSALPEIYATTSVAGSMKQTEHYIHHIDLLFNKDLPENLQEPINKVVYAIRHNAELITETPQWWDEEAAPVHTEAEKASWADRIKAYLGLKG